MSTCFNMQLRRDSCNTSLPVCTKHQLSENASTKPVSIYALYSVHSNAQRNFCQQEKHILKIFYCSIFHKKRTIDIMSIVLFSTVKLVDCCHVFNEVNNFAGICPLVVVPRYELDKVLIEHDAGVRIKDACSRIGDEVA